MTEANWLACGDPKAMLVSVKKKISNRKKRLFSCACCHRMLPLFEDDLICKAVNTAERFADGLASDDDRIADWEPVWRVVEQSGRTYPLSGLNLAFRAAVYAVGWHTRCWGGASRLVVLALASRTEDRTFRAAEYNAHAMIVRDIVGNPYRPVAPPTMNDNTVGRIAKMIYEERAFDCLPILADALEEAGCTDAAILDHLRGPGPHVRGCWALDVCLGRS